MTIFRLAGSIWGLGAAFISLGQGSKRRSTSGNGGIAGCFAAVIFAGARLRGGYIPNIRLLRVLLDGDVLIIFIQDTTYLEETRGGGFMMFSRRIPGADWHIATMYRQKYLSAET